MSSKSWISSGSFWGVILFAILVRWSTSLHSYSGEKTPPMFGDYEAQRHWMEVTINLPVEEWYNHTKDNDLMYWGLDYPPLTAYHSFFNGKLANYSNPAFVKLKYSRGFESDSHKLFMRSTVLLTDVLTYFVFVVFYFMRSSSQDHMMPNIATALFYPGLILIDHGHFQYNSISLGLIVGAMASLLKDQFVVSSVLFCLSLNYKQMSLYYSLPVFVYMLRHCLPCKSQSLTSGALRLICISFSVICTFSLLWWPFLKDVSTAMQVVQRLFPLGRGVFEDKVANLWCVYNVIHKIHNNVSHERMAQICICVTLLTSGPSLFSLFQRATHKKLILSLINVSLSFFMFSYQVHEKSILLPALPVLLYFPYDPFPCFWFLVTSDFSMLPLLIKDKLVIPFLALSILFALLLKGYFNSPQSTKLKSKNWQKNLFKILFNISISGQVLIFLLLVFVPPVSKYPDIWTLINSVYCAGHFMAFLLYFNYVQLFC